jgi:hypothetical protein
MEWGQGTALLENSGVANEGMEDAGNTTHELAPILPHSLRLLPSPRRLLEMGP